MSNQPISSWGVRVRSPIVDTLNIQPTAAEIETYLIQKYGEPLNMGPVPAQRYRMGFVSADDLYESLVAKLVSEKTSWLDVGCGRDIFPSNKKGAELLAKRARRLVGVDPDENIHENALLSDAFRGTIEDFNTSEQFSLLTMRMVAEHVVNAEECVTKLSELAAGDGLVVIYTPWKWAPMSLAASIVPFRLHNPLKRLLWNSEVRDTFPTAYRMNTFSDLRRLFKAASFETVYMSKLDDCSIFNRYVGMNRVEIGIRNALFRLRTPYPEYCLLAVFRRVRQNAGATSVDGDGRR